MKKLQKRIYKRMFQQFLLSWFAVLTHFHPNHSHYLHSFWLKSIQQNQSPFACTISSQLLFPSQFLLSFILVPSQFFHQLLLSSLPIAFFSLLIFLHSQLPSQLVFSPYPFPSTSSSQFPTKSFPLPSQFLSSQSHHIPLFIFLRFRGHSSFNFRQTQLKKQIKNQNAIKKLFYSKKKSRVEANDNILYSYL